jgi:galactokinase
VQEALRVVKFKSLLDDTVHTSSDSSDLLSELGKIMNESHESCRDLYDCSCPELDQICGLARGAGSFGSRLTGAGWGGCSVHLVAQDKVEAVKKAWKEGYYEKKFPGILQEEIERAIVVSTPGSGAMLFKVQK